MMLNQKNEFLSDPAVHKAINMAMDKENYVKTSMFGAGEAAVGPFPNCVPFGGDRLTPYPYDIEGAKAVLAEAGYEDTDGDGILEKDGKELSFRITSYASRAEVPIMAEAVQSSLKSIGIETTIESHETIPSENYKAGDFDIGFRSHSASADPYYYINMLFTESANNNNGGFANDNLEALMEQLFAEFDPETRKEMAFEASEYITYEPGFVFLAYPQNYIVTKASVTGFDAHPSDYYLMNGKVDIQE